MSVEDAIRQSLKRAARAVEVPQVGPPTPGSPDGRESNGRWIRAVAVVAATIIALSIPLAVLWRGFRGKEQAPGPANRAAFSPAISTDVPGTGLAIAATQTTVWASSQNQNTGQSYVTAIDGTDGRLIDQTDGVPALTHLVTFDGEAWGTTADAVVRISSVSAEPDVIPVNGYPGLIAVAGSYVWVSVVDPAGGSDFLVRITPASGHTDVVRVNDGLHLTAMAGTESSLWVIDSDVSNGTVGTGRLVELDAASGQLIRRTTVSLLPRYLVADADYVWGVSWLSSLDGLPSGTNDRLAVVRVSATSGTREFAAVTYEAVSPIGTAEGRVWFVGRRASGGNELVAFDRSTFAQVAARPVDIDSVGAVIEPDAERLWILGYEGRILGVEP